MKSVLLCVFLAGFPAFAPSAQDPVSSLAIGIYDSGKKALLVPVFINSVNRYLHRYEPKLIARGADFAKMQAKYDYLYDIEISVKDDVYEISVVLAEEVKAEGKAQKIAAHLVTGVHKSVEKDLSQGR